MLTQTGLSSSKDENPGISTNTRDSASAPGITTGELEEVIADSDSPIVCNVCKVVSKLTYICKLCGGKSYCTVGCYQSDWFRHKFSCSLGRPIDATDNFVLACHANEFPDEDVASQYGFMCFASGVDRERLFKLYRRLVVDWSVSEDELRSAVEQDKLKEMLVFRCLQTRDPLTLADMHWLKGQEGFGVNGKGKGLGVIFKAAQRELLSPYERQLPFDELQPPEKRMALVFYVQIRNGFKPDVDEDNWINLGFCTAADPESEQQLAHAYGLLVDRCQFDEFWSAMVESRMVDLFRKHRLAYRVSQMRNFTDFMVIVKKRYQSVWELKRYTRMNISDPFRAVMVDYGFMNCENAHQRIQLRELYTEFFGRSEDEMKLHEACVAGRLWGFLESVLGGLSVTQKLLWNPYPLENGILMGMVMTDSVTMCPESMLEQVNAMNRDDGKEVTVVTIPDTEDKAMTKCIHDRIAFLGTGLTKRHRLGRDGKLITELTMY